MFRASQIISNNAKTKELEDRKKFGGKMGFYGDEARKVVAWKKVIGTYRNYDLRVLLKSYQVKITGTNKPELRDIWK